MDKNEFLTLAVEGKIGQREKITGKGFYISYAVAGSGPTGDETALVKGKRFYILNGNWLEQYRALVPNGYKACKALFDKEKDAHLNFWSN